MKWIHSPRATEFVLLPGGTSAAGCSCLVALHLPSPEMSPTCAGQSCRVWDWHRCGRAAREQDGARLSLTLSPPRPEGMSPSSTQGGGGRENPRGDTEGSLGRPALGFAGTGAPGTQTLSARTWSSDAPEPAVVSEPLFPLVRILSLLFYVWHVWGPW